MDSPETKDLEQLKLLSVFHYVFAGITALFACIPIIHLAIGIMMIVNPETFAESTSSGEPIPAWAGWLFATMGGAFVILGWSFAVIVTLAGRFIGKQKHHTFCVVIAGMSCFFVPIGTALGVFTLIVLFRDSVKALFDRNRIQP